MNIKEIQQLIKVVEKSKIEELELKEENFKIRISKTARCKGSDTQAYSQVMLPAPPPVSAAEAPAPANAPAAEPPAEEKKDTSHLLEVISPMVGTFYAAPAPDADPYVKIGDVVKKGQVLCIVEAMKLMNEIESDYDGRIVEIAVDNAQPVEYNQVLFRIEPV
jgi:acetyl-CoA carboxylase biotin carboxyl carrier protein